MTYYTREQLDKLELDAADAAREGLGYGDPKAADPERAARLVEAAVKAGISHRVIAVRSGVNGLTIARSIRDEGAHNAALVAERHHAERYVAQVMGEIRARALYLHFTAGWTKAATHRALGITRPTLDEWVADAAHEQ